ncbi:MAG: 50S ribosomal protein P1 [Euryarchaeota archaeon]|nr:50S ribosomal protein P1 [Euryarchaeota archaeon]
MEYIYSALVLHAAGKTVDEDSIANVLKGAGMEPDAARIKAVTASLEGIDIDEAIASAAVAPTAAGPSVAAPAEEEKAEEKEEEDKPEVSEEDAAAGLSALFD